MAPARTHEIPLTGMDARLQARANEWDFPTSGVAPGYLQANLIVLPSRYAKDFEILGSRNPVPIPILASSTTPGNRHSFKSHIPGIPDSKIASGIDIRTDASRYNVYQNGQLQKHLIPDIKSYWDDGDHVGFLIGCSYSFENALKDEGLCPNHMLWNRNVSMYRTCIPLCPAGVFQGSTYVVSMRFYRLSEVKRVRDVTRAYVSTHGEPVAWGWDGMEKIGIKDVNKVDWGDEPVNKEGGVVKKEVEERKMDGLVPVFWGCGVSPQEAVMRAEIKGTVMGHAPGYMVVLDVKEGDILGK